MGEFGLPTNAFAWFALAVALLLVVAFRQQLTRARFVATTERHYRSYLLVLCLSAALGSVAYGYSYLRGGPRIIDATAYFQEARLFASGSMTSPAFEPSTATRGRFSYFQPDSGQSSILFPPGYPAILSLGFRIGAPWLVGALLAILLVWTTAELTRRLFERKDAALLAGLLSATTIALRYHTADTMSHGLAALLVTTAIYGTFSVGLSAGTITGLSLGWLMATRPVTGAAVLAACLLHRLLHARKGSWLLACALGLLPGVGLWFAYQWASTGSPWQATQYAYYAVADGPPGCFRYGFGNGIGCLFEHGDYIAKRLPHGYGVLQAAYVTLLRLRWHCLDVHNFEPLVVGLLVAIKAFASDARRRLSIIAIGAVIVGYLPFYFDASYPGGGARLFVDIIPLEHVLVAGWLVTTPWTRWFVSLSLAGFALHGAFEHAKLRDRDGGRPMFEPAVLEAAHVHRGLVFIDTDHGFFLGHDPKHRDAKAGIVVLRQHGDAHDRIAWQTLGRPTTYRYRFDPTARNARPEVISISPNELSLLTRFEAESQWPALAVESGWVRPVFPPNDCTSGRRGLSLEPVHGRVSASLSIYAEGAGSHRIKLGFVARKTGQQQIAVNLGARNYWFEQDALEYQCFAKTLDGVALSAGEQTIRIEADALGVVVDYWELVPMDSGAISP